jgi:hypothetical protein
MRKLIIITLLFAAVAFAQTEINWWVFDGGGGMRVPGTGDTVWASIGQPMIGCVVEATTNLCAGYLCLFEGTCVKIDEDPYENPGEGGGDVKRPFVFGINSTSPNPFNPTCVIEFEVESNAPVTFEFFDILGRTFDTPIRGESMTPGRYELTWGGDLPTGTYFARLTAGDRTEIRRIVYLK